jgi:hypothetical protein
LKFEDAVEIEENVEKNKVMRISRQPSAIQIKIDQIQQEDVEYFNCLGNLIINDAKCTREIISSFTTTKAAFNKKILFASKLVFNLRKKPVKCYKWSTALCSAQTWTLRKVDQVYQEGR